MQTDLTDLTDLNCVSGSQRLIADPVDNGSLAGRLFDEPGLVNAMFARCPLPSEGNFEAFGLDARVGALLGHIIASSTNMTIVQARDLAFANLSDSISEIVALTATINSAEARRAVAMEKVRREAVGLDDLLDQDSTAVNMLSSHAHYQKWLERTGVAAISAAIKMSEATVSRHANAGRELIARAPQTLAAALDGDVSWVNAQVVADTVAALPDNLAARFDSQIVSAAQTKNRSELKRKAVELRDRIHPTPTEVRHSEAACERRVWTEPGSDGMATLGLYAPAPSVHAIFDRLTRTAKHVAGKQVASAPHGGGGDAEHSDPRTLNQLRADTLISLALDDGTLDLFAANGIVNSQIADRSHVYAGWNGYRGDASDDEGRSVFEPWETNGFQLAKIARSIRPHVFLTVPVMTLLGKADEPALLDGLLPIDPQTAIELCGLAPSMTRILTHPASGQVIGVDTNTYRPPKDFQDYLHTRDTTCRFPGCCRKAALCDIDHTEEYADGGKTNVNNMALLCRAHHMLKTLGAFKLEQRASGNRSNSPGPLGALVWTDPFGRQYFSVPQSVPATGHPNGIQRQPQLRPETEWDSDADTPPF